MEKQEVNKVKNISSSDIFKIKKVRIRIALNEDIEKWSSGEVTKPETINYKTHKPEKDGLFDEKIFGPTKDFKCPVCGKKHKRSDLGKVCSNCGEAIIESKMVRRRKMGYIKLAVPIAHIWFTRIDYSIIRSVLGLKQDDLESILYFNAHIIYDNGGHPEIKERDMIYIQNAPSIYRKILNLLLKIEKDEKKKKEIEEKLITLVQESKADIGQSYGIDFYDYNDFIARYSDIKIGTGAETIKKILEKLDLKKEQQLVALEIKKNPKKTSNFRRNKVLESFIKSEQNPSVMILEYIPVIPADLRPLIQLDGGRHSTVDINELYRRIIIRNNRLKQWKLIGAPNLIIQNEKRMLQESVDALFDNTRKKNPINSKDNRPLKSLAENLKGKQGRFRQNLLGKRVDYSGRSVIVVGPELKLHQVGLPKQMVVKLFEPFIVNYLVKEGVTKNIKQAKKMIEVFDEKIWKYAGRVIKSHPVLLNRAPTLHRLSIQAFEPVITSGKAIRLHPLVTPSFNADFDGDQMAVHVPLSAKAKKEAMELMLSTKNILGPKDGKLILSPSQDIVLGIYYLTKSSPNVLGSNHYYSSSSDIYNLLILDKLNIHAHVILPLKEFEDKFKTEILEGYKYLFTTVGRILFNGVLPKDFVYINDIEDFESSKINKKYLIKSSGHFDKKFEEFNFSFKPFNKEKLTRIIEGVFDQKREDIVDVLDAIKNLGFNYSMLSGVSMSISDIIDIKDKEQVFKDADKKVKELQDSTDEGLITDDQRYSSVLKVWSEAKDKIEKQLNDELRDLPDNSLFMMMDSGARGSISNFVQLAGMRGSMSKAAHEYAALRRQGIVVRNTEEIPIKSSFKVGLTPFEYFLSTHGARKGLSDTATKTAESGYLTRRLVDAVQDVTIIEEDCGTNQGFKVKDIVDTRTGAIIEGIYDRILWRYSLKDIKDKDGNLILGANELITKEKAEKIVEDKIKEIEIRSVLTCNSHRGICKKCYGLDLTSHDDINVGEAIGIISAQSIGEPGTQLTMRTFHTGGVAGVADITQGFSRLMELVDANSNPKSQAVISEIHGKVTVIEKAKENKQGQATRIRVVVENQDIQEERIYEFDANQILRVKKGDTVIPGQKITEGSIQLQKLLEFAGPNATQTYLIKEIQKLYRIQGIEIADKYMEVIIRQMLSKQQIVDPGDSNFYNSQIVSEYNLRKVNAELFAQNKNPAIGKQIILGVKPLPLQSDSFLSAASYQRTAESLVNAAISKKVDNLYGVKESLIIGKKIPVGTGFKKINGKYNIFTDLEEIQETEKEANKNYDKFTEFDVKSIIKDLENEVENLF